MNGGSAPSEEIRQSRVPRFLGLVALGVLAVAFAVAVLGSWRTARWRDRAHRAEIAREEIARLEPVFERARALAARHAELAPPDALPPREVLELFALLDQADDLALPAFPERGPRPDARDVARVGGN